VAPEPLPVPREIRCAISASDVAATDEGGVTFTPAGAACLNNKLAYFPEVRVQYEKLQLDEFATEAEKIALARERVAKAEAIEGMMPRWLAAMVAVGTSMLAGGFGLIVGYATGRK
jgi:hypothetical protein